MAGVSEEDNGSDCAVPISDSIRHPRDELLVLRLTEFRDKVGRQRSELREAATRSAAERIAGNLAALGVAEDGELGLGAGLVVVEDDLLHLLHAVLLRLGVEGIRKRGRVVQRLDEGVVDLFGDVVGDGAKGAGTVALAGATRDDDVQAAGAVRAGGFGGDGARGEQRDGERRGTHLDVRPNCDLARNCNQDWRDDATSDGKGGPPIN